MIVVALIAIGTWISRAIVEWDPDPFFLNLTFFAIAAQGIKTTEIVTAGKADGTLQFLLIPGVVLVSIQTLIMRAHTRLTRAHYEHVLLTYKSSRCPLGAVDHWTAVLMQMTKPDLSPGSYQFWSFFFDGEVREKSRQKAFSILPTSYFPRVNGFTAQTLTIPASRERSVLWRAYLITCIASWVVLFLALARSPH